MADENPDSTTEFDEVDREWTSTTLSDPENSRHPDLGGEVEESDTDLDTDLSEAAEEARRLRGGQ
jgi:hypothetical protein